MDDIQLVRMHKLVQRLQHIIGESTDKMNKHDRRIETSGPRQ